MNRVITPGLVTELTVCQPVTPKVLLAVLATASAKLTGRARQWGRVDGEVEIENINPTTYRLTWQDAESEEPVSEDDKNKPFMPVNVPRTLSKGSGTYGSKETIGGDKVTIARDCATDEIGNLDELKQVIEYRLGQIAEQLRAAEAMNPQPSEIPFLTCTKQVLQSVLDRIEGPVTT